MYPAGLRSNVQLIRSSLCTNSALMHYVTLFPYGLGTKSESCIVISEHKDQVGSWGGRRYLTT